MKRMLLPAALAVGVLSVAGVAWSSGVLGGGPEQIRVYGGGQISTPTTDPSRGCVGSRRPISKEGRVARVGACKQMRVGPASTHPLDGHRPGRGAERESA